jgi:hypothetical protein
MEVAKNIHEIEKKKTNPSYDANLKCIQPSGIMDIKGVTCFDQRSNKRYENIVLTGDKFGTLHLLDLNKKQVVAKHPVTPGKRITQISSATTIYGDNFLTTVGVLSRTDRCVNIFRYRDIEYKIKHQFQIKFCQELDEAEPEQVPEGEEPSTQEIPEKTDISKFPFKIKVS